MQSKQMTYIGRGNNRSGRSLNSLTIGKPYDIVAENDVAVKIMNDKGIVKFYCKEYFKPSELMTNSKESTASYTKGEWYLQEYTDAYTNIVRCNNGKHETIFIASTPQSSLPEARANAKLMSAAPDLLEALQEVIAISDRDHVAWFKAKAAIEKAIGNPTHPCPHCGKELYYDRNMCCRECGKEVERDA